MNGAGDFVCGHVRAALGLERAGLTVALAREVDHRAVLRQPVAWLGESAMIFLQLFAGGTDIEVAIWIEGEVAARKSPVLALGLVDQFHVRLDPALVHQPDQARRGNASMNRTRIVGPDIVVKSRGNRRMSAHWCCRRPRVSITNSSATCPFSTPQHA
jgi:hypothetical protein